MSTPAVQITQLTKYYGSARGIIDVDMTINDGEIFGFVGPNGAGKSTTIRTLLGLIFKTSGSMQIFGRDAESERASVLADIGYLPSEVFYYDRMSAIQLLEYAASFYHRDCRKRIEYLADALHLDLAKPIEDMSLGNKKKVGIIQGLLHSPRLIILDEPTSGLDPLMQRKFFDLIRQENQRGATVLFSSHILSEVQKTCSRVAIIKQGKIIETRQISELGNNYCRVSYVPLADNAVPTLDGIFDCQTSPDSVSFLYRGPAATLLGALSQIPLRNIEITEPSLEEIFLHHYED